ncbi:nuclear pore complex protein NUP1-like [Bidens hawaiensis]|uniref:nuclear pore complex protein NUP1-like n=1 Tax=Bidens hawaiensis TaxID=980011 RepID=UPI00404B1F79
MATTDQSGGKLRKNKNKKPVRLNSPYDRPANQPSLFAKLVSPASRLIYAGADSLFSVFRQPLPVTSEEPRNESLEAGPTPVSNNGIVVLESNINEGGEVASISAVTEISEFENMLKQKTFTRSEIERLTTLLHSRTIESDIEGDSAKPPITASQVSRLEASTSGMLKEHVKERKTVNFHVPISTPITSSSAFEDDVATPAELAKAYMGTKSAKLSPLALRPSGQPSRQDPLFLNNTTVLPKTPVVSLTPKPAATFKTFDSCLTTPRSQGRSALYKNARSPYYRGPSTLSQKGVASPYALEQEGSIESSRMGAKRWSSVIDETEFGGPMRRIRQKVNLPSHQSSISKHKSEFASSQKLLLRNEPEPKSLTPLEENVETSKRNLGYDSVPRESSRMASKIFEQLKRMSPKEKPSGSRLAGTTEKIDSPNFLSSSRDNKRSRGSTSHVVT